MNNQSPLVPQGSLLEQKNKGRARVKIAVFFVLAVHGIGLLALLMQGCKRDTGTSPSSQTTNTTTQMFEPTNPPLAETTIPASATNNTPSSLPPLPTNGTATPGTATDYKVVKGDTLGSIAKNHKVTLKALMDANPGVDATKLQINQVIHIPAPASATVTPTGGGTTPTETPSGEKIYVVKSGDSLTTIAKSQGTTIKALRSANNLKTDQIKVGDKLKIPAGSTPPAGTNTTTPTP